jgi:hypothetical protein
MAKAYRTGHAVYRLNYDCVWIPKDRRKVFVEIDREKTEPIARVYARFGKTFESLSEGLDAVALKVILTYLRRATDRAHTLTREISGEEM